MKGNILVTGGSGFIGSRIVNAFSGHTERKIFVYDVNALDGKRKNVITLQGDIFNSDKLLKVMRDGEISDVIHMVGLASIPECRANPDTSFKLNVASVQTVLEVMRLCKAERLVFASTAAIYGATNGPKVNEEVDAKPSTVYGSHKMAAEQLIRDYSEKYDFKPTILRIFNVYGDLNQEQGVISLFIRKAMAREPLVIEGGNQLRDFVFLNDVVEAVIKSLNGASSHRKTINVGSGVGVSIKKIAEMIKQSNPDAEIRYEPPRRSEYSIYADVSRMKNLLGCVATHPMVGIPRFIEKCKHVTQSIVGLM